MNNTEVCPICKKHPVIGAYQKLRLCHCPMWHSVSGLRLGVAIAATEKGAIALWNKKIQAFEKKKRSSMEFQFERKYKIDYIKSIKDSINNKRDENG